MSPQASSPVTIIQLYRRLLTALAARARRLGSRNPEAAAQETLKRAMEHSGAQQEVEYYFSQDLPPAAPTPEWPLDQVFFWLYGVLNDVVREERNRVSFQREVSRKHLDVLLPSEIKKIVADCLPKLEPEYRRVLRMRANGMSYREIAGKLGVNENTVATWISRGIRDLGQWLRKRMEPGEGR